MSELVLGVCLPPSRGSEAPAAWPTPVGAGSGLARVGRGHPKGPLWRRGGPLGAGGWLEQAPLTAVHDILIKAR